MRSRRTKEFRERFAKLSHSAQRQANEAYQLFRQNPFHPSLQFKQIDPADPTIYSARVGAHYRAMGSRTTDDLIVWFWIGSHAEYDKLG
jgi:hypothetical protein